MEEFAGVADGDFAVVPDDVSSGAPFLCEIVEAGFCLGPPHEINTPIHDLRCLLPDYRDNYKA